MRYSRKDIWIACLIAVLVAVTVGATFHDISGEHDRSVCQVCAWLQMDGGLAAASLLLLVFFALQATELRRSSERLCRSHRFFRLRAPPYR